MLALASGRTLRPRPSGVAAIARNSMPSWSAWCGRRETWPVDIAIWLAALRLLAEMHMWSKDIVSTNESVGAERKRLRNVGVLSKHDAKKFCVVGPTARGSGLHIDTRKDHPYAAYKEISFDVPTVNDGDVWARTYVRILEMIESLSIVEQALGALPSGPIKADRKEIPPWQEGTRVCEAPRGEDLHFVITGENNRPWRLKVRSPSVVNVPSLTKMLPGYTVADSVAIIGSIDPCFSCTDRVAIVKEDGGVKEFYSFDELIKMCRRKYGGV